MTQSCLSVAPNGHLTIGGVDTLSIAREFGTPAYVLDENAIRDRCRVYRDALHDFAAPGSMALYAGKALCFRGIYPIINEEGLGADVVSPGELHTALAAGFPPEKIFFHGNNKTDEDIRYALSCGIGFFIVDNTEELEELERQLEGLGKTQDILLRITPGIDPHTHRAIKTGCVDSKFGSAIETGQARAIVAKALSLPHIRLRGLHCHIGSQIFDSQPFVDAAAVMVRFLASLKKEFGFEADLLDLGGGLGVPYLDSQPQVDYRARIREIADEVSRLCTENGLRLPSLLLEPGRSLVAHAGITLYTVGSVKVIPGFRTYVSIDGGMADNPRYALYQSQYEAVLCEKADQPKDIICTLAGRCCESGDLIGEGMPLQSPKRGDILAVLVTGAYNDSMSSHYNRLTRPPILLIRDGVPRIAVKRETFDDLLRNE